MKKILYVSMSNNFGGIERLELDYYNNLSNKYYIDILTPNLNMNKNIKSLNINRNNIINKIKYDIRLYKYLKNNKYDIVHINSSIFLFSFQVVMISKLCKIKKIITHSHSIPYNNKFKKILIKILNPIYRKNVISLSCSKEAIKSLYTNEKDVIIINNGINVDKYKFNNNIRNKYRKELNISNKKVYGNISNFDKVKNHDLLIDIFYKIQKIEKDSILLLIGDGSLKDKIEDKVDKLNIKDKVLFLGFKEESYSYLNAMDIYLSTSLSEGFGLSLIEAQTNGLITYSSNNVPSITNINNIKYFDINSNIDNVVSDIINEEIDINSRYNSYKNTIKNKLDIKEICKKLDNIYRK